jgi:hypothetical protein
MAAAGLLLLAFSPMAGAQDGVYPKEIQAIIEESRKACKDGNDTDLVIEKNAIRKIELSGDRLDDYIVDFNYIRCGDAGSFFCGTGGCDHQILVAKPGGSFELVHEGPVRKYTIVPGKGPRTIKFHLHGSACGRAGVYDCRKSVRITGKKLDL